MTYYFYDLETSSGSPRNGRIMQFAGQRTDEYLQPVGEPDNVLVKLADDVVPEPDAILVHGITPQKTLEEGLSEVEFIAYFQETVAVPGTVFVGYNNIRFDDEFMRRICYRTFHDPYQWHWKDKRGRWDLLDAIRMMRALRPDGLKWPMLKDKPSVKLELMARENDLEHENAHDALSDVTALIQLAQKFKNSQPKLFNYLSKMRDKRKVAELALGEAPFVYTSGRYSSKHEKTSVVISLFKHPRRDASIIYDLRSSPEEWLKKTPKQLVEHWSARWNDDIKHLPVKTVQFNKCPAVAPLGVLDEETQKRIAIDLAVVEANRKLLAANPDFSSNLKQALDIMEKEQQTRLSLDDEVDNQIYDGFWGDGDQADMTRLRHAKPEDLGILAKDVAGRRIREMIPLYKARNYLSKLTPEEREVWEDRRRQLLSPSKLERFSKRMAELGKTKLSKNEEYLLTELQLYVESILPEPAD